MSIMRRCCSGQLTHPLTKIVPNVVYVYIGIIESDLDNRQMSERFDKIM